MTRRRGRYRYVVDNLPRAETGSGGAGAPGAATGAPQGEVRLWLALPTDHPGQRAWIERLEPEPLEVVADLVDGNRIAVWRERPPTGGGALVFTIDFELEVAPVETTVDPAAIAPYDEASEAYRRNVCAEDWLERTPEIEDLGAGIAGAEANPWLVVRRLFDWTRANLTYVYPEVTERGAAKALARRTGDCGDFAHVFAALCRARGIPARTVTACWFTGSGHQWAEVLVPPYGWLPVDPSMAHAVATGAPVFGGAEGTARLIRDSGIPTTDPAWLCGNLYPNRLIVAVGTNIEVRPRDADLARTFAFLQPGGGNAWPPAIEIAGLGERPVHGGFFLFDDAARDEEAARRQAAKALAQGWLHAGDLDRAEAGIRLALEDAPDNAFSWFHLGQAQLARQAWPEAREAFGRALAGRGGSLKHLVEAWGHVFVGMCHDAEGRRDEAIREYDLAIASGVDYQGSLATARGFRETAYVP